MDLFDKAEAIAAELPDVVALQEIGSLIKDGEYERQVHNLAFHLSAITGQPYQAIFLGRKDYLNNWDMPLWASSHGVSGAGGAALISRLALAREPEFITTHRDGKSAAIEFDERFAADNSYQLFDNRPPGFVRATLTVPLAGGSKEVDFYSVHLLSGDNKDARAEQIHAIERLVRKDVPAFLMGDMNAEFAEVESYSGWRNIGDPALKSYSVVTHKKQIDWILYRGFSAAAGVNFYEATQLGVASYDYSDHTPVVLEATFTTCEPYNPAIFNGSFCAGRDNGDSQCRVCGRGEGGCTSDAECAGELICNAGYCDIDSVATQVIPGSFTYLAQGGFGPFPLSRAFYIHANGDEMFNIKIRTRFVPVVGSTATPSAWLTIDGVPVAQRIRLRSTNAWSVVPFKHVAIAAGDHVVGVHFSNDRIDLARVKFVSAPSNPYEGFKYVIGNGDLQAEDFDVGGYTDNTPNNDGGLLRYEGPDIYLEDGNHYVMMDAEEEILHTVHATSSVTLNLSLHYKSVVDQDVEIYDDAALALSATLPGGPDWQVYDLGPTTFFVGDSVLRFKTKTMPAANTAFQFDHYRFEKRWEQGPVSGTPWPTNGQRVQAEYFDFDGFTDVDDNASDEIAYRFEVDPAGHSPDIWHFRSDFVTDDSNDNSFFIWKTAAGERLSYTLASGGAANGSVTLHYAAPAPSTVHIERPGANTINYVLPASGGWGKNVAHWDDFVISGVDLSGGGKMTIVFDTGGMNLDWIVVGP